MASGKESPRQKMINLMYLVFIAMLALNMSKEVLSAFGVIDEDINSSTETYRVTSMQEWKGLKALAEDPENSLKYEEPFKIIDSIYQMGGRLDAFINKIKPSSVLKIDKYDQNNDGDFTDLIPDYEAMDKTETIDVLFFTNKRDAETAELKNLTDTAVLYLNHIKDFRDNSIAALTSAEIEMQKSFEETYPDKKWTPLYTDLIKEIGDKFNTDDHKVGKNKVLGYVKYHYEGYPLISSVTKMSVIQDNVQKIIAKTFSKTLGSDGVVGGTNTLKAVVLPGYYDKDNKWVSTSSTVYEGENFKGKIVLAKYDSTLAPSDIKIPNFYEGSGIQAIQDNKLVGGQLILDGKPSSGTGRKSILGSLNFDLQKGSRVDETVIPVTFEYEVTKKPSSANIANVRMDVVYKSVPNYLSISIPNVSTENIIVSANGKNLSGGFKNINENKKWVYTLSNPSATRGKKGVIDIKVTTKAYEGSPQLGPFVVPFRVKDLPNPISQFAGSAGFKGYTKKQLAANRVEHAWPDDFDLGTLELKTKEFMIQVGNNSPRKVTGNKITGIPLSQINKSGKGTVIIIYNVNSSGKTNNAFKRTTPDKVVIKIR
ncbi:hypothetical protein N8383_00095 [Flavobacteriaceae bacterium]|nr:hypothetical protein [Flavobacteriaceae bacterium]MDC1534640.1 hypothetical protein [Flavobacteriaceae bacterium]